MHTFKCTILSKIVFINGNLNHNKMKIHITCSTLYLHYIGIKNCDIKNIDDNNYYNYYK